MSCNRAPSIQRCPEDSAFFRCRISYPNMQCREEHSMDQYRSRLKLSENFELPFSWGNSYGPMVLKVLLKFPPILVLVHGWLFPAVSCCLNRLTRGKVAIASCLRLKHQKHALVEDHNLKKSLCRLGEATRSITELHEAKPSRESAKACDISCSTGSSYFREGPYVSETNCHTASFSLLWVFLAAWGVKISFGPTSGWDQTS